MKVAAAPCSRFLVGLLESVRKVYEGLQSLLSIRRIEASHRNASALSVRFSKSLASRRQRLSHAKVRSTTPAHRQHDEAFGLVRSLDDLYRQMGQAFRDSFGKLWSLITGIGKQFGQKRIHPEQCGQQQRTTITVLDIRRMHDGVQQQS